jgi:hypothetical protein
MVRRQVGCDKKAMGGENGGIAVFFLRSGRVVLWGFAEVGDYTVFFSALRDRSTCLHRVCVNHHLPTLFSCTCSSGFSYIFIGFSRLLLRYHTYDICFSPHFHLPVVAF